jgi:hypothetical protein
MNMAFATASNMSISSEYLKSKIDEKRLAIQRLDRDRERLLGELAAYEDMLAQNDQERRDEESNKNFRIQGSDATFSVTRGRGLSTEWKEILKRLSGRDSFDYDDAVKEAEKSGSPVDKVKMRSKMHQYVTSQHVERIEDGVFRITDKGREAVA